MAADLLAEVQRREKALGVEPDWDVDAMMKAGAVQGAPNRCSWPHTLLLEQHPHADADMHLGC